MCDLFPGRNRCNPGGVLDCLLSIPGQPINNYTGSSPGARPKAQPFIAFTIGLDMERLPVLRKWLSFSVTLKDANAQYYDQSD